MVELQADGEPGNSPLRHSGGSRQQVANCFPTDATQEEIKRKEGGGEPQGGKVKEKAEGEQRRNETGTKVEED